MKLRQKPEDFIVEEIAAINIGRNKDSFHVFMLEKKSIETFYLLDYLSKKYKIPRDEFGIAGLKDKHAVTKQYLTIPAKYNLGTTQEQNFKLTFLGYTSRPLKLGDLEGNKFIITIRDIRKGELEGIQQKAVTIQKMGVPNYFDSQRFGSVVDKEFIVKALLQKNYEHAVKLYMTKYTKFESKQSKNEKRSLAEHWNSFEKLSLQNKTFRQMQQVYAKTRNWLAVYQQIPASLREIYISAYQSYLWNECIKELLRKTINKKYIYAIPYAAGSLFFYKKIMDEEQKKLTLFQTISDELQTSGKEKDIIDKILAKEQLTINDFNIKEATGNFFKTAERRVILKPEKFSITCSEVDECNDRGKKSYFKITLSFILPKGSYATIITKRLFNR